MYFFTPNNHDEWSNASDDNWFRLVLVSMNNRVISIISFDCGQATSDFSYYYNLAGKIE